MPHYDDFFFPFTSLTKFVQPLPQTIVKYYIKVVLPLTLSGNHGWVHNALKARERNVRGKKEE